MRLTPIAQVDVVVVHVPMHSIFSQRVVIKQTVVGRSRASRIRIGSGEELRKVISKSENGNGIVPINFVDSYSVLQPEEAVDMPWCEVSEASWRHGTGSVHTGAA
jgi:hypothetical protein